MAIKRPLQNLTTFSMSSMTDVIFLLLIFFMVTSTLVFPTALDVNLPQSGEQSSQKPVAEIYITADSLYYFVADRNDTAMSRPQGLSPSTSWASACSKLISATRCAPWPYTPTRACLTAKWWK